jgi:hypothetical protein
MCKRDVDETYLGKTISIKFVVFFNRARRSLPIAAFYKTSFKGGCDSMESPSESPSDSRINFLKKIVEQVVHLASVQELFITKIYTEKVVKTNPPPFLYHPLQSLVW